MTDPTYAIPIIVAASAVSLIWQLRRERAKRAARASRLCVVCGYDLRSSPEVCPECGMPAVNSLSPLPLNLPRLNHQWPVDRIAPQPPPRGERLALVHPAATDRQAELLANQLMARGVWAETRPGPECSLVLVPATDVERATAIVATFRLDAPKQSS